MPGGFAGVYGVLKALEESGKVRRGYFVDGLGAAQFAVPGAVDRIRAVREPIRGEQRTAVLLARDRPRPAVRRRSAMARRTRSIPRVRRARSSYWSTASSPRSWSAARAAC